MSFPSISRRVVLPALLRPGMYAGVQGGRTKEEWLADAVVVYLHEVSK